MLYAITHWIDNLKPIAFTENDDVLGIGPEGPLITNGKERVVLPTGAFTTVHLRAMDQSRVAAGQGKVGVDGEWHALLWTPNGLIDLGPGIAFGIDEAGYVGGKTWDAGISLATKWNADGIVWRESTESEIFGVGRDGTLFGTSRELPCLWNANGDRTDLPLPAGNWVTGFASHGNSSGQVVGGISLVTRDFENIGSIPEDEDTDADVLWTDGKPQIIHRHSGYPLNEPCGISEKGRVLLPDPHASPPDFYVDGPLLFEPDGTLLSLYSKVPGPYVDDVIEHPTFQGRSLSVTDCDAVAIDADDRILVHHAGGAVIFAPSLEAERFVRERKRQMNSIVWTFPRRRLR